MTAKSTFALILILAGLLSITYGAGMLPLAEITQPTKISKNGVNLAWSTSPFGAPGYTVHLTIEVPKNSTFLVGTQIYVWVYREATFKAYDEVQKTWIYRIYDPTLWGPGGSAKLRPFNETSDYYIYGYNVDFESATSSWSAGLTSGWQFVQWGDKGTLEICNIRLDFEFPINLPQTPAPRYEQSETELSTPQEAPPVEATADVVVPSRKVNWAYVGFGVLLVALGLTLLQRHP